MTKYTIATFYKKVALMNYFYAFKKQKQDNLNKHQLEQLMRAIIYK
jgi:hypothetical protein